MLNAARPISPNITVTKALRNNNLSVEYNGIDAPENPALHIFTKLEVIWEDLTFMNFNVLLESKKYVVM